MTTTTQEKANRSAYTTESGTHFYTRKANLQWGKNSQRCTTTTSQKKGKLEKKNHHELPKQKRFKKYWSKKDSDQLQIQS